MQLLPHPRTSKPEDINPYNSQGQRGGAAGKDWVLFPHFTDQETEAQVAPKVPDWNNIN